MGKLGDKKVIIKFSGGLGNQMFQYAAGRAFADKLKAKTYFDVSIYQKDGLRNFELNQVFQSLSSFDLYKKERRSSIRAKFNRLLGEGSSIQYIKEGVIDPRDIPYAQYNTFVLDGYWQSELYFKQYAKRIRNEFSFKPPINAELKDLLDQIKQGISVGVHVRRGDYIANAKTNAVHGFLGENYYFNALKYFSDIYKDIRFFVFSDDKIWCRYFFSGLGVDVTVVDKISDAVEMDMFLMSQCEHNIIANSSYSWWSAWLNTNPKKTVIAPERWFSSDEYQFKYQNIVPPSWLKF